MHKKLYRPTDCSTPVEWLTRSIKSSPLCESLALQRTSIQGNDMGIGSFVPSLTKEIFVPSLPVFHLGMNSFQHIWAISICLGPNPPPPSLCALQRFTLSGSISVKERRESFAGRFRKGPKSNWRHAANSVNQLDPMNFAKKKNIHLAPRDAFLSQDMRQLMNQDLGYASDSKDIPKQNTGFTSDLKISVR